MKTTQSKEILKYLETHPEGITSLQAIEKFGATRLSSIIHKFRNKGYNITTEMKTGKNRYGGVMQYAVYKLVGEDNGIVSG